MAFFVVSHAYNNVDVSIGLRHHPVESLIRGIFFFMAFLVCSAPIYAGMIFQTLIVLASAFIHANIALPTKVDHILNYTIFLQICIKYTASGNSLILTAIMVLYFRYRNRLLGTFLKLPHTVIRYELDKYYSNQQDEDFTKQLKSPYLKMKKTTDKGISTTKIP